MAQMTITEALGSIKVTLDRIEKKEVAVINYSCRDAKLRDPMEKEGGSAEFVRRERQAIKDLQDYVVRVRTAIQRANLDITLEIEGIKRTLAEWLNWRREIAKPYQHFLDTLTSKLNQMRQQAARAIAIRDVDPIQGMGQNDLAVNISEKELTEEIEKVTTILGQLDLRLSLHNATTVIEV